MIRGLSSANESHALGARTIAEAVMAMRIGFGPWWLYFDFIARRPARPVFSAALSWVYLHLVVLTGIVTNGVAVGEALAEESGAPLPTGRPSSAPARGRVDDGHPAALEITLDRDESEPTHLVLSPGIRAGVGALLCLVAALQPTVSTVAAFGLCLVALAVPAAYGALVWSDRIRSLLRLDPLGVRAWNRSMDAPDAASTLPVACTLGGQDGPARLQRWRRLAASGHAVLTRRGAELEARFDAGEDIRVELTALAAAERECCGFLHWSVVEQPAANVLRITASATSPDDVSMVEALFR